jgi:hypothetical protein
VTRARQHYDEIGAARHARIGVGDDCVLLIIEDKAFHDEKGALILDPKTARALGRALSRAATQSEAYAAEANAA